MSFALAGCKGSDGADGANGTNGTNGSNGTNGTNGGNIGVAAFHGTAVVTALDELQGAPANPKYLAKIAITGASANAAGVAKVTFTVKGKDNTTPVTGITAVSAGIFKLAPAGGGLSYNRWVPYIYRIFQRDGVTELTVNAGYREATTTGSVLVKGTLVENSPGNYTYTFGTNLQTAQFKYPVNGQTLVGYDRTLTHRVSVYIGGHSGPTGEADFDFVPDGVTPLQTRDIVRTETCKKCHGAGFAGHGGDRVTVEGCNGCHSPNSALKNTVANGGTTETIEMQVMIHKIHAGRELPSVAGLDGQFYDNPWTAAIETDDNGEYRLGNPGTWNEAAFPAGLANCQACHTGAGANVDNWKTVPSRASCGSCHDNIDFTNAASHSPAQTSDANCAGCHDAATIEGYHDWTVKDPRNIPEFDVSLTTSAPANGTHFVAGESPVITIVLTDKATGQPIDHTTIVQDPAGEGCIPNAARTGCTLPNDGLFTAANVYVSGPRGERVDVLTYAARADVTSATAGPWDLSAGGSFRVRVDSGTSMLAYNTKPEYEGYGAEKLIPGDITVTLPADLTTVFANPAAATAAELATWLNTPSDANKDLPERAIAYVDEKASLAGRLSIRSRGVMVINAAREVVETTAQRNIQVVSSPLVGGVTPLFADNTINLAGGAGAARRMTTVANTDPKVTFTAANLKYTLDPVDDLVAGTYVINVEFADRGRGPTNPPEPPYVDYKTPSVAVATFQVKAAAADKAIADNCTSCHWSAAGRGFVLDYPRHNKLFNEQALDQCGGCHDYSSGVRPDVTAQTNWSGGLAISKRVHAVHNGAALTYPTLTVGHEETSAFGRNWRITYPMDVRNCESCHSSATTGSWQTNPNRLACMGCHDADAATSHVKLQTWDPTPLAPFSGDEAEACSACH